MRQELSVVHHPYLRVCLTELADEAGTLCGILPLLKGISLTEPADEAGILCGTSPLLEYVLQSQLMRQELSVVHHPYLRVQSQLMRQELSVVHHPYLRVCLTEYAAEAEPIEEAENILW